MRKIAKKIYPLLLLAAVSALAAGCGKKKEEVDLRSVMTTAQETVEGESTSVSATLASAEESQTETIPALAIQDTAFTQDKITISYPKLSGMEDSAKESRINALIAQNATAIAKAQGWGPDTEASIGYKIVSQSKSRIGIVYSGTKTDANGSANIFYTNTIDLNSGKDLGLSDFTDPYTMAGYVLSDDVILSDAFASQSAAFMDTRKNNTLEEYTALFKDADFPIVKPEDSNEGFPSSFSYEAGGDIFFSVPVSHDQGDYVVVKYSPDTK